MSARPNPPLLWTLSHTARNMLRVSVTCCATLLAICAVAQVCSLPTPAVLTQVTGPVKAVVIPICVASHWFQSLAIIKELSHRGHSLQEGRRYWCRAVVNISELCQSFWALQSPQEHSVWYKMCLWQTIALQVMHRLSYQMILLLNGVTSLYNSLTSASYLTILLAMTRWHFGRPSAQLNVQSAFRAYVRSLACRSTLTLCCKTCTFKIRFRCAHAQLMPDPFTHFGKKLLHRLQIS